MNKQKKLIRLIRTKLKKSYTIDFKSQIVDYINSIKNHNTAKIEKAKLKMKFNISEMIDQEELSTVMKLLYMQKILL